MEKTFFKIYKTIKNKIDNPKAFIDIAFLDTNNNKIKGENFFRLIYEKDRGISLIEFMKNIYGYSTYLAYNDDLKKINNDASKELNSISFLVKDPKRKSKVTDFTLSNYRLRRGYNISKFSTKDKARYEQYLALLDVILSSKEDSQVFFETMIRFKDSRVLNLETRNYGTMLVMFDPNELFYHVAEEQDLKPIVETLYTIKPKKNNLLSDFGGFENADFEYYLNLTIFKNQKTNEVYALICLADNNTNESFLSHKIFKLDNKLKNIEDVICSSIYMFFEEFGIPTVINTVSPILYEYLLPIYKNGIEIVFNYDSFHTALMRHITNMILSYITKYEISNINLNEELIDKIFMYFKYLLMNSFNPIEHYLVENDADLYQLIDDFFNNEPSSDLEEETFDDENDTFIN